MYYWVPRKKYNMSFLGEVFYQWSPAYLEYRAKMATAYAVKRGAKGTITGTMILNMLEHQRLRCSGCKERFSQSKYFQIDHDFPVSRGGDSTVENLNLLCKPCNLQKFTLTDAEWQIKFRINERYEMGMIAAWAKDYGRGL